MMSGIRATHILTWPPDFDVNDQEAHFDVSGSLAEAREHFASCGGDTECISRWMHPDMTVVAFRTAKIPDGITADEYRESWQQAEKAALSAAGMPA